MGRWFVTPSKVALLALARVYLQGAVPLTESTHLLSFLIRHILQVGRAAADLKDFNVSVPISEFEKHFAKHASSIPGRSIWDIFLKTLWTIDCSAALDTFINQSPELLLSKSREQLLRERDSGETWGPPGKVLRTSPLGIFIRRLQLEYTGLQFEDSTAVWQDLVLYRGDTRGAYEKKNDITGRNMLDVNLSELGIEPSHPLAQIVFDRVRHHASQHEVEYSIDDVGRLLDFQVSEMQRSGGRLPDNMQSMLKSMIERGAPLAKQSYYLKFLDSWRAGSHSSALDNLHRYFDYTMQSHDRTRYQYALLNLAVLQADFGCHAEAVPAISEAITTARENKDTVCLNFCLNWLYQFGRTFPVQLKNSHILASESDGLAFLKSRAKDAEMWSLLSTSLLNEAKLGLQRGQSLALVFENIVKADHINHTKAVQDVTGPTLLMKGSAFGRIGQSRMAQLTGEIFLDCYRDEAPIEDVLKCYCRQASLLSQQGRYTESEATILSVPEHILKVLKYYNYWTYHSGLLQLRRHLHRDDLDTANQIVQRLRGQGPPDIESDFSLRFLEIDLHTRRGDLEQAFSMIEELADRVQVENNDIMVRAKLMVLKAGLWAKSDHIMKGFSLIVRAASMAYNARLLPLLFEVLCGLVRLLLEVHQFEASDNLLEAITPQVLECHDCDLAARVYSYLADANMGLAGLAEASSVKRKEHVALAMEHINTAFKQFKFLEDLQGQLEMLAKKAKLHHLQGDFVLANDTASQYLEIRKEYLALRA